MSSTVAWHDSYMNHAKFVDLWRFSSLVDLECTIFCTLGLFTHEPRAMTMKSWEPKRKCPKAVPTHFQNHVVWSWALKCSVKSYATMPSIKCYFNECLFMQALWHTWLNGIKQRLWAFGVPWSHGFVVGLPPSLRWFLKIIQVTMKLDPFDAM